MPFGNMCHSFGLIWDWNFSPVEHVDLGRSIPWEPWVSCRPSLLWVIFSSISLVEICPEWGWEAVRLLWFLSPPEPWHAYIEEAKQMRHTSKHIIWVLSLLIKEKRKLWKGEQPSNLFHFQSGQISWRSQCLLHQAKIFLLAPGKCYLVRMKYFWDLSAC